MFGGNATLTLESARTKVHYTYKITESDDGKCFFVSALTGADNSTDFKYIGYMREGGSFKWTGKSRLSPDAPCVAAFKWFADRLDANKLHSQLKVWHEGRCGVCNRKLTVPSSVASGIGPDCAEKRGLGSFRAEAVNDDAPW
jgi:hypothetical protein